MKTICPNRSTCGGFLQTRSTFIIHIAIELASDVHRNDIPESFVIGPSTFHGMTNRACVLCGFLSSHGTHFSSVLVLGPDKTSAHCGGNIVSCDVARPWQNTATFLRAARTQGNVSEDFQKYFFCPGHQICVRHKFFARGKTSQHLGNMITPANVSAATMCPHFAGAVLFRRSTVCKECRCVGRNPALNPHGVI